MTTELSHEDNKRLNQQIPELTNLRLTDARSGAYAQDTDGAVSGFNSYRVVAYCQVRAAHIVVADFYYADNAHFTQERARLLAEALAATINSAGAAS